MANRTFRCAGNRINNSTCKTEVMCFALGCIRLVRMLTQCCLVIADLFFLASLVRVRARSVLHSVIFMVNMTIDLTAKVLMKARSGLYRSVLAGVNCMLLSIRFPMAVK